MPLPTVCRILAVANTGSDPANSIIESPISAMTSPVYMIFFLLTKSDSLPVPHRPNIQIKVAAALIVPIAAVSMPMLRP